MNSSHKDDMDVGGMNQEWEEEEKYSQEQMDEYWWQYEGMDEDGWNEYEELGGDWNQDEDEADAPARAVLVDLHARLWGGDAREAEGGGAESGIAGGMVRWVGGRDGALGAPRGNWPSST